MYNSGHGSHGSHGSPEDTPSETVVSVLPAPCEVVAGIWVGTPSHTDDDTWFRSRNIHTVLNCAKHFEGTLGETAYNYHDRTTEFVKKAVRLLLSAHYGESKNCIIVCQTGLRMSVIVLVHYLSTVANISRTRALDIIRTKLPLFYVDTRIQPYVANA